MSTNRVLLLVLLRWFSPCMIHAHIEGTKCTRNNCTVRGYYGCSTSGRLLLICRFQCHLPRELEFESEWNRFDLSELFTRNWTGIDQTHRSRVYKRVRIFCIEKELKVVYLINTYHYIFDKVFNNFFVFYVFNKNINIVQAYTHTHCLQNESWPLDMQWTHWLTLMRVLLLSLIDYNLIQ